MPAVTYYLPSSYAKREKEILEAAGGGHEGLLAWERDQIRRWLTTMVARYQKWEIEGEWTDFRLGVQKKYAVLEIPAHGSIPLDMPKPAAGFKRAQLLSASQIEWSRKVIALVRAVDKAVLKKERLPPSSAYYETMEKTVGGVFARYVTDAATQLLTQRALREIADDPKAD